MKTRKKWSPALLLLLVSALLGGGCTTTSNGPARGRSWKIESDREARQRFLNFKSPKTEGTFEHYVRQRFHRECEEVAEEEVWFFINSVSPYTGGFYEILATRSLSGARNCGLELAFSVGSITASGVVQAVSAGPTEHVEWLQDFVAGR